MNLRMYVHMIIRMNMYSSTSQLRPPVCGTRHNVPNCEMVLIPNLRVHKVRTMTVIMTQCDGQTGGLLEAAFESGSTYST